MKHFLMNSDRKVLSFDLDDYYIEVLNNDFLPYELRDYVQTTNPFDFKKSIRDIDVLKDFLISRTLNLSRENAKIILNVANLPQSLKTEEKLKIVFACKGLTMEDNFWIKEPEENICFEDVCLRKVPLSDASYVVSILGRHISATAKELRPDLSSSGIFPKYWKREQDKVFMWKTDKTTTNINTSSEIKASKILQNAGANVVEYRGFAQDGKLFSVSECIANDEYSLVKAQSIMDYCNHTEKDFLGYLYEKHFQAFANMCVSDYVLANTDRHSENWGFLVRNENNKICSFAPLYDLNQSLVADEFETNIDELVYEPTQKSMFATAMEMLPHATLRFNKDELPQRCQERLKRLTRARTEDKIIVDKSL